MRAPLVYTADDDHLAGITLLEPQRLKGRAQNERAQRCILKLAPRRFSRRGVLRAEARFALNNSPDRVESGALMSRRFRPIDVADFPELRRIADEVQQTGEPRLLQRDGEDLAVIVPIAEARRSARRPKTEADHQAFLSAAGGWADLDTDKLVADIYADRRRSNRPPIEL